MVTQSKVKESAVVNSKALIDEFVGNVTDLQMQQQSQRLQEHPGCKSSNRKENLHAKSFQTGRQLTA